MYRTESQANAALAARAAALRADRARAAAILGPRRAAHLRARVKPSRSILAAFAAFVAFPL